MAFIFGRERNSPSRQIYVVGSVLAVNVQIPKGANVYPARSDVVLGYLISYLSTSYTNGSIMILDWIVLTDLVPLLIYACLCFAGIFFFKIVTPCVLLRVSYLAPHIHGYCGSQTWSVAVWYTWIYDWV